MFRAFTIISALLLMSFFVSVDAQIKLSENAKISLMTTSPWSGASYALFGHTAIYVSDDSTGVEGVFNYGFFDMSQPFFMYNFVRGKTDYLLGVQSLDQFLEDYAKKGVEVVEQELNLRSDEKQEIWEALYINQLPENRMYRYNYFYDNCVTRPRDLIEIFTKGEIKYPDDNEEQTYRDLIHECVNSYPWMRFGIDLIIGSDADKPITLRQKMFLPVYLKNALTETVVIREDSVYEPIILSDRVVVEKSVQDKSINEWSIGSPMIIAFALIILSIIVSLIQIRLMRQNVITKIYDSIIFGVVGAGGIIIFFLSFFSEHPAVDSNWNFVWMNIFTLIVPTFIWLKRMKNVVNFYHFINFVVLSLFILLWWAIPQQLPIETIFFSISIWIRSGINTYMFRKDRIINKRYSSSKYIKSGWNKNI